MLEFTNLLLKGCWRTQEWGDKDRRKGLAVVAEGCGQLGGLGDVTQMHMVEMPRAEHLANAGIWSYYFMASGAKLDTRLLGVGKISERSRRQSSLWREIIYWSQVKEKREMPQVIWMFYLGFYLFLAHGTDFCISF